MLEEVERAHAQAVAADIMLAVEVAVESAPTDVVVETASIDVVSVSEMESVDVVSVSEMEWVVVSALEKASRRAGNTADWVGSNSGGRYTGQEVPEYG